MGATKQFLALGALSVLGVAVLCKSCAVSNAVEQTNSLIKAALELAKKSPESGGQAAPSCADIAGKMDAVSDRIGKLEEVVQQNAELARNAGDDASRNQQLLEKLDAVAASVQKIGGQSGNAAQDKQLYEKLDAVLACTQKLGQSSRMAAAAMAMAATEMAAGHVESARLCYLNAINQNPSAVQAYVDLEKTYETATATELEGLRNVLLTAQYRVEPGQLAAIQEVLARVTTRWQKELDREVAAAEKELEKEEGIDKPVVKPVDLCAVLSAPQPAYAKAIADQKAYVDAVGDGAEAEAAVLALQNLMLLQKVDALIPLLEKAHPELAQMQQDTIANIIDAAFDAVLQPQPGEEGEAGMSTEDKKLVEQQLAACASYLDQLLHNNATAMTMKSPLSKHLFERVSHVESMSLIWQALNDAAIIRQEGPALFQEAVQCYEAVGQSEPKPAAEGPKGPLTTALVQLSDISKRLMVVHGDLGSGYAKERCVKVIAEKLSPVVTELNQKRTEAYNRWAIDSIEASYNFFVNNANRWSVTEHGAANQELQGNTLRPIDTSFLYPHVAQLYQEYVAYLMGKVDGDERAKHKIGIARAKKRSIEQY